MADFLKAFPVISENEGGYCEIKGDKGGETYCGISRVNNPRCDIWGIIDSKPHPIKWNTIFEDLKDYVISFYKKYEWDTICGDLISSQAVATYVFDWHVNSGGAVKQIQKLIGAFPDGVFGEKSVELLNSKDWLNEIHKLRCAYYKSLNQPQFEKEWLARANKTYNICINQIS